MNSEFSFKELYEVSLKVTYPIEIGNQTFEAGETIAFFDKIQLANFSEVKNSTSANGGKGNYSRVIWESTKEVKINLTQGVFSKAQFALMSNAALFENSGSDEVIIDTRQEAESDDLGQIFLKSEPAGAVFVYNKDTGKKLLYERDWTISKDVITLAEAYTTVIVDYSYKYSGGYTALKVGHNLTQGYLSLTGRTRVKDDETGKIKTGIIRIPRLRLMSDLSIVVGRDAIPQVLQIDAVAVPRSVKGQTEVMEIIFLSDDIDADI